LSKEDEATTGGDEVEVRREDQDKINKFSRLHQREIALEEELKSKHVSSSYIMQVPMQKLTGVPWQKEKEDLEDISNELELADEDDKIPYALYIYLFRRTLTFYLQLQNRRLLHLITFTRSSGNARDVDQQN
jgi:hypothetical protein